MTSIPASCSPVNARSVLRAALREAEQSSLRKMGRRISETLAAIVSYVLGRPYHKRRRDVPKQLRREGRCRRCSSTRSQRFSRNGSRPRRPVSRWGELPIDQPRVVCECGGSVKIDFGGILRPYQRICDDVDAQIVRWGDMALSLRQMQRELSSLYIGSLSLRTLIQRLHRVQETVSEQDDCLVPPVLQIDAIWITQLRPNGQLRRDRKGRLRPVKGRFKRPLLLAMGVWPDTGRAEMLAWQLAQSEDAEEWIAFLSKLEAQGIRGENGLQLIIHDGGSGLCAALNMVHFDADEQRCLFHKLRNIYQAIEVDETLTPKQRKRRRKAIFRDFRAIYEASRYETMLRRYLNVCRKYRHSQPRALAALQRDFRATITYYYLEQQFPTWERKHLRTTSRLERFNRSLRRHTRAANAYHSDQGILSMVSRVVKSFHAAQANA